MARNKDQSLIAEIDALEAKLNARLDELVAEERKGREGVPPGSLRICILPRGVNIFYGMRRVLSERANQGINQ